MALGHPPSGPALAALGCLLIAGSAAGAASTPSAGVLPARPLPLAAPGECPPFPGADAFVDRIDNRYLPLIPGATYIYKGLEDGEKEHNIVEITHETRTIIGVETVVVRDTVTDRRGRLIEQTLDWFAQDEAGNVWYLGEDSKDYENGQVVSSEGSWEAGVDGAQPGIVMEANPQVGDAYLQECAPGVAEDAAEVRQRKHRVKTHSGTFGHTLLTRETNALEPGVAEEKAYAQCVGLVHVVTVQGGKGETSLVKVKNGPGRAELGCKAKPKHKHKHRGHRHGHGH